MKSFRYAINGISILFRSEHNAWLHATAAIIAILLAFLFQISMIEWIAVTFCIGSVISMEMINTAVEKLCNHITTTKDPQIKMIKDLSAGAVLVMAIVSLVVGGIIFLPYILR